MALTVNQRRAGTTRCYRTACIKHAVRPIVEQMERRTLLSTVAYWRFEDGAAGANIAGPVVDQLGLNALSVQGAPTYNAETAFRWVPETSAANSRSARFNNSALVSTTASLNNFSYQQWTIEATVKLNSSGQFTFIGKDGPGTQAAADLWFQTDQAQGGRFAFYMVNIAGQSASVRGTTVPVLNQWYHVAATSDGATLRLYVNGQLEGSQAITSGGPVRNTPWTIGRGYYGGAADHINGSVDEVRFSDVVLHPSQFLLAVPMQNVGFESPAVGMGNFKYEVTVAEQGGGGWAFVPNAGVASNGSDFLNPYATSLGAQVGFLQQQGSFSQSFSNVAPAPYTLTFVAAGRRVGGTLDGANPISVSIDGKLLTFGALGSVITPKIGSFDRYRSDPIFLEAGTHVLQFSGTNVSGDRTSFVDDIVVAVVPTRTVSWTGVGGNGLWTTPSNWSSNAVPSVSDAVVISGTTVTLNGQVSVAGLTLSNGAILTHTQGQMPGVGLNITGDVSIDAASKIDVSGKGFGFPNGGPGYTGGAYPGPGGSYGGLGGNGSATNPPAPTYGSAAHPTDLGSGGSNRGGVGGGAVGLTVGGTLYLNGQILANGTASQPSLTDGGGSGGSVLIHAHTVEGSGTIRANGGNGTYPAGGGSGGRIAIHSLSNSLPRTNVTATGGTGYQAGGAGTIVYGRDASITVTLDPASDSGALNSDGITAKSKPTFDVTVNTVGRIDVDFDDDGIYDATQAVGAAGGYAFTPSTPVAEGSHIVRVVLTPASGPNVSATLPYVIDTTGPSVPSFTSTTALSFDGINDIVVIPHTAGLNLSDKVTVEAWVTLSSLKDGYILSKAQEANSEGNYNLRLFGGKFTFSYWDGTGVNKYYALNVTPVPGRTYHVAIAYDFRARVIAGYVNGEPVTGTWLNGNSPAGTSPVLTSNPLTIGAGRVFSATGTLAGSQVGDSFGAFHGTIDEVRLWSVIRSRAEVGSDMMRRTVGLVDGIVADWRFDEGQGNAVTDSGPLHHDGALGGNKPDTLPAWVGGDPKIGSGISVEPLAIRIALDDIGGIDSTSLSNSASYVLVASGGDGLFGQANDVTLTGWLQGVSYDPLAGVATLSLTRALDDDLYRFTIIGDGGISDLAGNALRGGVLYSVIAGVRTVPPTVSLGMQAGSDSGVSQSDRVTNVTSPTFDVTTNVAGRIDVDFDSNGTIDASEIVAAAGTYAFALVTPLADGEYSAKATIVPAFGASTTAHVSYAIDTRGPRVVDGDPGGALTFNGLDQYVSIPSSASLRPTASLTIEAWVRPAAGALTGAHGITGSWNDLRVNERTFYLSLVDGKPLLHISNTGLNWENLGVSGPTSLVAGQWYHLAGTYDGAMLRLFVNGIPVAQMAASGPIATNDRPFFIGRVDRGGQNQTYFSGSIDDVRLWNVARTHAQIARGLRGDGVSGAEGLRGWWRLDENVGIVVSDSSGFGNAGVLTGNASDSRPTWAPSTVPIRAITPVGEMVPPLSTFLINFDAPIDPTTLSTGVTLVTPDNVALTPVGYTVLSSTGYLISFGPQLRTGTYSLTIGPGVKDLAGNLSDHNANGINGESTDGFEFAAELLSPDLQVTDLAVTPNALMSGQSVTLNWNDFNGGNRPTSGAWVDRVQVHNLTTGQTLVDATVLYDPAEGGNGNIEANGRRARSFSFALPRGTSGAGQLRVTITADSANAVPEYGRTGNADANNAATTVITSTLPAYPDLVVTNVSIPTAAYAGERVTVVWTITNAGNGTVAGTWTDRAYLSSDRFVGADALTADFGFTGTIAAGQSVTRQQSISLPLGLIGSYYAIVASDATGQVFEDANENNNSGVSTDRITIGPARVPNLQVTPGSVVVPVTATAGTQKTITWTVRNVGTSPTTTPVWHDAVYLSQDQVLDAGDRRLGAVENAAYLNPGESYTGSLTVTIPVQLGGDYFFIVKTDDGGSPISSGSVFEYNREDDNATASTTRTTVTPALTADVQLVSVDAPSVAGTGETVTVSWVVRNVGPVATANAWPDVVYLSRDTTLDAGDSLLGTLSSRTLAPNESYTASKTFTLPSDLTPGSYYFIVWANPVNVGSGALLFEQNQSNNTGFDPVPTSVTLVAPDLEMMSVVAPASATSGQPMTVTYTVQNFGNSTTGSWTDLFYLSADPTLNTATDVLVGSRHRSGLPADQSYTNAVSLVVPNGLHGTYYVIAIADGHRQLFELGETNNVGFDVEPVAVSFNPPDLVVSTSSLPVATAQAGGSFLVSWSGRNRGAGPTVSSWSDKIVLSADDVLGNADDRTLRTVPAVSSLAPNQSYDKTNVSVEVPFATASGSYFVFVVTDSANQVLEGAAEGNNASIAMPLVITRQVPDLQVTAVAAPASVTSGGDLTIAWTVGNAGEFQTNVHSWTDAVYLSADAAFSGDDVQLGTKFRSGTLGPNGQYDATATYAVPIDLHGTYFVIVRTDVGNQVVEDALENNNTRAAAPATVVALTAAPDLSVTAVTPPSTAYAGQSFSLTYTVANLGGAVNGAVNGSGSWYDAVYISADQVFDRSSDTHVGFVQVSGPLATGTSYTRTGSFAIPQGLGGNFYVFVETDSGNRVYERGSEGNNVGYGTTSMGVAIPPPADLTVGAIIIPANSRPGQVASVTYTVKNQGTSAALGSWNDALYISMDGQWDINDAFFGRVLHTGNVAAGSSYTHTVTAALPGVLPGDYQLIVRSDIRNAVPESDEANNFGASLDQFNVSPELLTLGTAVGGTLGQGASAYYRVVVQPGETLVIRLDSSSSSASNELYVRFGQMPTRSVFDYAFTDPFSPDQKVVVPSTQGGTYYVLAYGDRVAGTPSQPPYTITASTPQFGVFDTDFGTAGDRGRITLKLTGAKFTTRTTARIRLGGVTLDAVDAWLTDPATLYATFDLRGANLGRYDVIASDPVAGTATVPASLNVVRGRGAQVDAFFSGSPNVVLGRTYPLQLRYGNTGDSDGYAPLLTVTGAPGVPFGLSPDSMIAGQSIQFLGIGDTGPVGVIRPGEEFGTQLFFRSAIDPTRINLTVITAEDPTPIDWASLRDTLKPNTINQDAWNAVFDVVTAQLPTWGDFVVMLNDNSSYLSALGQRVADVGTLWTFEVQQAIGSFTPLSTLASAVDASMPAPGVPLELTRSFGNTIVSRYGLGMFGRGWASVWDTYVTTNTDGSVNVFDATGLRRQFRPGDNGYMGSAGDPGVLLTQGGGYLVRETSGFITSFRPDGKLGYIEDTNGNRLTATWTNGRLTRLAHRSGQTLDIGYNAGNRVSIVTDSAGRSTNYTYDASNQHLLTVTAPDGKVTTYAYVTGQGAAREHALTSVTSGGVTRTFTYQSDGKLDKTFVAANQELVDFNYDSAAQVMVLDGANGETNFFYDQRQLLVRVDDALGNSTKAIYDVNLRISQLIDPLGQSRSFTWCDCGSLTGVTDEAGNKTQFVYEFVNGQPFKRMTSFIDAKSQKTSYTYDSKGNLLTTVYPDNSVESLSNYDQFGNAGAYTNRRKQILNYTYNAAGQVLRQTFADTTHADFTYDTRGNLLTVTDASGVTTYTYDYAITGDRLRRVTYPNGRYLDYSYDSAGRRWLMVDQTGFATQYDYDTAGRLWHVRDGAGAALVTYTYDPAGRLSRIDKGNGTYTTYQYDAAGQILHLINFAPGGSINSRFDYTYDKLGRRTTMGTIDGDWAYTYDKTGQLIHAVFASTNVAIANQDLIYEYDAVGNRIRTTLNGVTTNYATNNLNQYTTVGGQVYTYDADGNLTFDGVNTYTYDQQNQLVSMSGPEGISQYEYDGLGNRVASIVNGQRTEYLLDPIGLVSVIGEFDSSGVVANRNVYGLGLISRTGNSGASGYFDFDAIGSVASLTTSAGAIANAYAYLPFGETLVRSATLNNPFGFVGRWGVETTSATGLSFMRARFGSLPLGRFTSIDPLRLGGGDENLYRYTSNSPINFIDPVGLASFNAGGSFFGPTGFGGGGAISLGDDGGGCVNIFVGVGTPGGGLTAGGSGSLGSGGTGFSWNAVDVSIGFGPISVNFGAGTDGVSGGVSFSNPGGGIGASVTTGGTYCWPPPPPLPLSLPPEPPLPANRPPYWPPTVGGFDPNDLIGPAGFGDDHWIPADQRLSYTIRFENDLELATAPAHVVRITQALDIDLDFRTFRVGDFGFGSVIIDVPEGRSFYTTRLDLLNTLGIYVDFAAGINVLTGEAFWELTSIDPATGEVPLDPNLGFLPPNRDGIEGQGFIQYSVRAKTSVTTGTRVDALARIIFDINAPIDTPPIFNTLDADKPTSTVATLPTTTTNKNILVSWSGGDPPNGSALANYTIFVSDNGGAFTPWLTDTTLTQATFAGAAGHTYAFYSLAKDNAGNVESAPAAADTQVRIETIATIVGRSVFYNNSSFDGNDPSASTKDDAAIAIDKQALLSGQTATFANYTSYSRGINGIMVDIAGLLGDLTVADFKFKVGNSSDPSSWLDAPAPLSIVRRIGAGVNGSDRIVIVWADNAIQKQWLEVTVVSNATTTLAADDVFYFGNAIGETGNRTSDAVVDQTDTAAVVAHPTGLLVKAPVTNVYDFNRDGKVNAFDFGLARDHAANESAALVLFTAPVVKVSAPAVTPLPSAQVEHAAPSVGEDRSGSTNTATTGTALSPLIATMTTPGTTSDGVSITTGVLANAVASSPLSPPATVINRPAVQTVVINQPVAMSTDATATSGGNVAHVNTPTVSVLKAPKMTLSGPAKVRRNKVATFSVKSIAEAAKATKTARYGIDWNGDGRIDQVVTAKAAARVNHKFATAGKFNVVVTILHANGRVMGTKGETTILVK